MIDQAALGGRQIAALDVLSHGPGTGGSIAHLSHGGTLEHAQQERWARVAQDATVNNVNGRNRQLDQCHSGPRRQSAPP